MIRRVVAFLAVFAGFCAVGALLAQEPAASADPPAEVRKPGGVSPPRKEWTVEPKYTDAARDAGVSGTVVLSLVVNPAGRAQNIEVLRPLGFGLDETAVEAVQQWRFHPATRNGQPVNVFATVEVNFRIEKRKLDENATRQRTTYLDAAKELSGDSKQAKSAAKAIGKLAEEGYPPAAYTYGRLLEDGKLVKRNSAKAKEFFELAAAKGNARAICVLALAVLEGRLAGDRAEAIAQMEKASMLGSRVAQRWLGIHYLDGNLVPLNRASGERHLRLCASKRDAQCQSRLGRFLLERFNVTVESCERHPKHAEAVAWLLAASQGGDQQASEILQPHLGNLSEACRNRVEQDQSVLIVKPE